MKLFVKSIVIIIVLGALVLLFVPSPLHFRVIREAKKVAYALQRLSDTLSASAFAPWIAHEPLTALPVPLYYQKYSLSCELAALRMALAYEGVKVPEDELISKLTFATTTAAYRDENGEAVWADPNKGFVGKINGKMPQSGYGVYEKPLLEVALNYHPARILEPATLETLLNEISLSHPVVVWGTVTDGESMSWKDNEGNSIPAIHGEHARVVVGFAGKKESPSRILLLDPVYGKISMSTAEFLRNWAMLGNRALVLN